MPPESLPSLLIPALSQNTSFLPETVCQPENTEKSVHNKRFHFPHKYPDRKYWTQNILLPPHNGQAYEGPVPLTAATRCPFLVPVLFLPGTKPDHSL